MVNQSKRGHTYSQSSASATSWATISSRNHGFQHAHDQLSDSLDEDDPYCPPLMVSLLHALSLLQTAVQGNRVAHFQPSTACIISCVRSILAATGTLRRDAPIFQRFAVLTDQRRRMLTVLASLVAQAKKASEENLEAEEREVEVEDMLRLGGQVFSHVRRFLTIAVNCGIELPKDQNSPRTATPGIENIPNYDEDRPSPMVTPTQPRGRNPDGTVTKPGTRIVGPRSRERPDLRRHDPALHDEARHR